MIERRAAQQGCPRENYMVAWYQTAGKEPDSAVRCKGKADKVGVSFAFCDGGGTFVSFDRTPK